MTATTTNNFPWLRMKSGASELVCDQPLVTIRKSRSALNKILFQVMLCDLLSSSVAVFPETSQKSCIFWLKQICSEKKSGLTKFV